MAARPKTVFLIVDSGPTNKRVVQDGQPPTTMAAYAYPIEGNDSIEDTVRKHATGFPLGSVIRVTTDAKVDRWVLGASLEPAT